MTSEIAEAAACIHACQTGCGRTIDLYVIQVIDLSTLAYCIPCLQQFVYQMTRAMVEPDAADIREVVEGADFSDVAYVNPWSEDDAVRAAEAAAHADEFQFDGT